MDTDPIVPFMPDWGWGLPLVALMVMFHVAGLSFIRHRIDRHIEYVCRYPPFSVAVIALYITLLHSIEATLWGVAYLWLGALPDMRTALLYSLNAVTSYGHTSVTLEPRWQLMGALEALNGWILFGLSTAYLFALIQHIWSRSLAAWTAQNVVPGARLPERGASRLNET